MLTDMELANEDASICRQNVSTDDEVEYEPCRNRTCNRLIKSQCV